MDKEELDIILASIQAKVKQDDEASVKMMQKLEKVENVYSEYSEYSPLPKGSEKYSEASPLLGHEQKLQQFKQQISNSTQQSLHGIGTENKTYDIEYKDEIDDFLVIDSESLLLQRTDDVTYEVTDDVIYTNDEIGVNQIGLDLHGLNDINISQNKKLKCYYCQEYGHSVYQCGKFIPYYKSAIHTVETNKDDDVPGPLEQSEEVSTLPPPQLTEYESTVESCFKVDVETIKLTSLQDVKVSNDKPSCSIIAGLILNYIFTCKLELDIAATHSMISYEIFQKLVLRCL